MVNARYTNGVSTYTYTSRQEILKYSKYVKAVRQGARLLSLNKHQLTINRTKLVSVEMSS